MSCKFILSKRIRHVFHGTLLDSAIATEKGHRLIINHHDDNNTNTLASFLGLRYEYADMVDLFMQCGCLVSSTTTVIIIAQSTAAVIVTHEWNTPTTHLVVTSAVHAERLLYYNH